MSIPAQLSESDKANIISLPYRVGLWVSRSDSAGGADADAQELSTLANIIDGFAGEVFGSELVQHIMSATLARRGEWADWAEDPGDIPKDCRAAAEALAAHVEPREVAAYVARLMEIGEAVALAFREREEPDSLPQKITAYSAYGLLKLKARLKKRSCKSFDQFLNISTAERKALEKLAAAMGTAYI
ncbi:MAG: hypothetical protein KDJ75_06485 [Alphaproteobacteria bacterium]|nr:hypothetical protein [Alphaproteobacteria bacterium]